jgi:hypothetical protein
MKATMTVPDENWHNVKRRPYPEDMSNTSPGKNESKWMDAGAHRMDFRSPSRDRPSRLSLKVRRQA